MDRTDRIANVRAQYAAALIFHLPGATVEAADGSFSTLARELRSEGHPLGGREVAYIYCNVWGTDRLDPRSPGSTHTVTVSGADGERSYESAGETPTEALRAVAEFHNMQQFYDVTVGGRIISVQARDHREALAKAYARTAEND